MPETLSAPGSSGSSSPVLLSTIKNTALQELTGANYDTQLTGMSSSLSPLVDSQALVFVTLEYTPFSNNWEFAFLRVKKDGAIVDEWALSELNGNPPAVNQKRSPTVHTVMPLAAGGPYVITLSMYNSGTDLDIRINQKRMSILLVPEVV